MDIYVQPEILIDGEKSLSIYRSIKISLHYNTFSSFIVSLPSGNDIDISTFFSGNKRLIGKKITLVLRSGKEKKDDLIFTGFIDQIQFSQNQGLTPDLVIRAFDPSKMLDGQPDTNTFIDMSIEEIVDQVLKPYSKNDLKLRKQNVRNSLKFDYLVQYKESDYNFLRRIASATGNWFFFNGTEMFLGNPSKDSERKLFLGNTISDFQIEFNTIPFKTKFIGYNFRKSEKLDFELKDSDLRTSGNSVAQDLVKSSGVLYSASSLFSAGDEFPDLKAGQEKNKIIGESIVSQLVLLHGTGRDSGLLPGKFISINSPLVSQDSGLASKGKTGDKSYGSYMIITSTYDIEQGGEVFSEFSAVSSSITAPLNDSNFANPVCESQPAEVVDNEDPEGLGRVKVRFFWQDNAASTPWIRIDQIHAGNEYGSYFVPEIGDQVMIGFQDGNPDRPYVLGAVYHKKSNQKANQEKGNNIKTIKTRSGN
jgi:type VI secretion system secreted protein VgrG